MAVRNIVDISIISIFPVWYVYQKSVHVFFFAMMPHLLHFIVRRPKYNIFICKLFKNQSIQNCRLRPAIVFALIDITRAFDAMIGMV